MPPPYHNPHWQVFTRTPHVPAGAVGYIPSDWVTNHRLHGIPTGAIPLPTQQLDRTQVRDICQNLANPVLFGYICVMAWGLQGAGPGGQRHVASSWGSNAVIAAHLNILRSGGLTRSQAYQQFLGAGNIPGLGPSYWTKLLYFFSLSPLFFIMDQWTGKSINLLTNNSVVRMAGNAPSNLNNVGNYQAYCEEVDAIATHLGVTGEQAEEMLMSKGGHHPWQWRHHVRNNWPPSRPVHRYNAVSMHTQYPHIPLAHF